MDKKEIVKTMRDSDVWRPAADCHLWLWATSNHLKDALWVMEVLGFEYKTSAVWVKCTNEKLMGTHGVAFGPETETTNQLTRKSLQIGLGQYMRHAHEWLLLGTRGKAMVPPPEDRMPSVIFAPRTKHSKKPGEAYELIESVSPGPRLEMFARRPMKNWDSWGNEI
jgi:N6-adenosine-specific RNA methylase IME4